MILNKITTGFVIQQYDTETKKFVSQEFIAGDEVEWEQDGDTIAPIQNASITADNPAPKPKTQPIPKVNFASPSPIHLPFENNQIKKNGLASNGPDAKFITLGT
jgi:hypothetical protein